MLQSMGLQRVRHDLVTEHLSNCLYVQSTLLRLVALPGNLVGDVGVFLFQLINGCSESTCPASHDHTLM